MSIEERMQLLYSKQHVPIEVVDIVASFAKPTHSENVLHAMEHRLAVILKTSGVKYSDPVMSYISINVPKIFINYTFTLHSIACICLTVGGGEVTHCGQYYLFDTYDEYESFVELYTRTIGRSSNISNAKVVFTARYYTL